MHPAAATVVEQLGLTAHPEGGYFREFYRSEQRVTREGQDRQKPALTGIYFLLHSGQQSRWHCVRSDEQWTFLEGDPLELFSITQDGGELKRSLLGPRAAGHQPTLVVPAGSWQAARPTGGYGLVTCTVAPGFEYADFQFLADNPDALKRMRAALGVLESLL